MNGYCKLSKVSGDYTAILRYMFRDSEKHFLGTNCTELFQHFNNTSADCGKFKLGIDECSSGFEDKSFIQFGEPNINSEVPQTITTFNEIQPQNLPSTSVVLSSLRND